MAQAAAAVLACGRDALLGQVSGAALWGFAQRWPELPEVTAPTERRRPGIRTHICRTLTRADIRRHLGIRVTSPARTALEIAPRLTDHQLERAVNDARLNAGLRPAQIQEILTRLPTHPGARALRAATDMHQAPTRSVFEDAFLRFTERFGLPAPRVNARIAGHEVDALFPDERVIVELDGFEYHRDRRAFERDRERDAATLAAGYPTVRVTWTRFTGAPEREASRLHAILRARGGGGAV